RNSAKYLTTEWIWEVMNMRDRQRRSHLVPNTYRVFADDLNQILFGQKVTPIRRNANWFHFAAWGTETIGVNIRHKQGPQRLRDLSSWLARLLEPAAVRL